MPSGLFDLLFQQAVILFSYCTELAINLLFEVWSNPVYLSSILLCVGLAFVFLCHRAGAIEKSDLHKVVNDALKTSSLPIALKHFRVMDSFEEDNCGVVRYSPAYDALTKVLRLRLESALLKHPILHPSVQNLLCPETGRALNAAENLIRHAALSLFIPTRHGLWTLSHFALPLTLSRLGAPKSLRRLLIDLYVNSSYTVATTNGTVRNNFKQGLKPCCHLTPLFMTAIFDCLVCPLSALGCHASVFPNCLVLSVGADSPQGPPGNVPTLENVQAVLSKASAWSKSIGFSLEAETVLACSTGAPNACPIGGRDGGLSLTLGGTAVTVCTVESLILATRQAALDPSPWIPKPTQPK